MKKKIYTKHLELFSPLLYTGLEGNIMRKLTDSRYRNHWQMNIKSATVREPGLEDYITEQDIQHRLDILHPVWGKRHARGRQFKNTLFARKPH